MDRKCSICSADLGPWEGVSCISCALRIRWTGHLTIAERALWVLEAESGPISVYDVWRGIKREFGGDPGENSIGARLATDLRFCWVGRGMYGLYRHRVLPGPRNLAGVAKFLLYAVGTTVNASILAFLMGFMGYRFHQQSLINALARDPDVTNLRWKGFAVDHSDETAEALNRLGFAPSMLDFHILVSRWQGFMFEGLEAYERRTSMRLL